MFNFYRLGFVILFSLFFIVAATGCDEIEGWNLGVCNGGEGFVDEICSGPAFEAGELEIEFELDNLAWKELRLTFEYDRGNLYGEHISTVIFGNHVVHTPEVISEGRLYVYATAVDPTTGIEKALFTVSNRADRIDRDGENGEAEISAERSITILSNGEEIDWSTGMSGGRGRLTVELTDYLEF